MNKKEMLKEKIKLLRKLNLKNPNFKETFSEAEKTKKLTEDYLKNETSENYKKKK